MGCQLLSALKPNLQQKLHRTRNIFYVVLGARPWLVSLFFLDSLDVAFTPVPRLWRVSPFPVYFVIKFFTSTLFRIVRSRFSSHHPHTPSTLHNMLNVAIHRLVFLSFPSLSSRMSVVLISSILLIVDIRPGVKLDSPSDSIVSCWFSNKVERHFISFVQLFPRCGLSCRIVHPARFTFHNVFLYFSNIQFFPSIFLSRTCKMGSEKRPQNMNEKCLSQSFCLWHRFVPRMKTLYLLLRDKKFHFKNCSLNMNGNWPVSKVLVRDTNSCCKRNHCTHQWDVRSFTSKLECHFVIPFHSRRYHNFKNIKFLCLDR